MLVVTRDVDQKIFIGPDITIMVVSFRYGPDGKLNGVRLGIDAPKDVKILRDDCGPARNGGPR